MGSGPSIDPHPTGSLSVEEGRAAHTEPFPVLGALLGSLLPLFCFLFMTVL